MAHYYRQHEIPIINVKSKVKCIDTIWIPNKALNHSLASTAEWTFRCVLFISSAHIVMIDIAPLNFLWVLLDDFGTLPLHAFYDQLTASSCKGAMCTICRFTHSQDCICLLKWSTTLTASKRVFSFFSVYCFKLKVKSTIRLAVMSVNQISMILRCFYGNVELFMVVDTSLKIK